MTKKQKKKAEKVKIVDLSMKNKDSSDYRKHPILTKTQLKRFRELGCQCKVDDPVVVIRFFSPIGSSDWYATEYNEKTGVFYGLFKMGDVEEWLTEWDVDFLKNAKLPMGMRIERSTLFSETKLSELASEDTFKYHTNLKKEMLENGKLKHWLWAEGQ